MKTPKSGRHNRLNRINMYGKSNSYGEVIKPGAKNYIPAYICQIIYKVLSFTPIQQSPLMKFVLYSIIS